MAAELMFRNGVRVDVKWWLFRVTLLVAFFTCGCVPAGARQPEWAGSKNNAGMSRHTAGAGSIGSTGSTGSSSVFLQACRIAGHSNPRDAALSAVLLTFEETSWTIIKMNLDDGTILARACLRNNPLDCAMKEFRADGLGRLTVGSISASSVRPDLRDDMERWLIIFDQKYSRICNYSDEHLDEKLSKYKN